MSASSHNKSRNTPVILLPGDRFFVRRITLVNGSPLPAQLALALETLSPFSLEQLFHGSVLSASRGHALVYAAYRRTFSNAEQEKWGEAQSVLPEFLYWAATKISRKESSAILFESSNHITAVAWDDACELPSLILSRAMSSSDDANETRAQLLAEVSKRTGIPVHKISTSQGNVTAESLDKVGLSLSGPNGQKATLPAAALTLADIRDKALLATRQSEQRHSTLLWRLFATSTAALALCILLEGGLWASRSLLASKQQQLADRTPEVQQIESAQALASRLEKMTAQQLRPFEMLAVVNSPRPASVEFLRVSTNGPRQLEIDAQTSDAGDLRNYENALRQTAGVEKVDIRDPRMRAGRTSFQLEVTFKPDWSHPGGSS